MNFRRLIRRTRSTQPDRARPAAASYYSADYSAAKRRFLAACRRLGLAHHALAVDAPSPNGEPLTIDVAVAGGAEPRKALIVSSGVHGVEGPLGSAVQASWLERLPLGWQPPQDAALVFIHAVNPFGYAWRRRFNEENVDLNRNFLLAGQEYAGAPPLCGEFRRALMPRSARPHARSSAARIALLALRHGTRSFWETLPVGQYEFPDWLFFGGSAPSQSAELLRSLLPSLLGSCEEMVHLDFHTGLGRWGDYLLLLSEQDDPENVEWWKSRFGAQLVVEPNGPARTYEIRGGFGTWLRAQFPQARYRFATAEFGTYSPLRVIRALTDELHWHARLGARSPDHWSRRRLADAFAPPNPRWREKSLEAGVSMVGRAADHWSSARLPRMVATAS